MEESPVESKLLEQLKEVRDNIVHTKNLSEGFPDNYGEVFRSTIDVDYQAVYASVKSYINFYKPNWIEEDS